MTAPTPIKSLQHPHVKHLVRLRENRRYRVEQQRVVICTEKLLEEISLHSTVCSLLVPEGYEMSSGFTCDQVYEGSPQVLQKAGGLTTSSDLVAEVQLPAPRPLHDCRRLLVLDRLADPGNIGTLLRTALALRWDGLFLLKGTADPFNDKALRASRGALFQLPFQEGTPDELEEILRTGYQTLIADTTGRPVQEVTPKDKLALVLGNEAQGPDKKITRLGDRITIPMPGKMESLNVAVAGGILIFSLS